MKNRNSEIISYLRQYSIKDNSDIIIDLFEEESYNYKIIYKVSASVNGITEIYINGNKVYYDKIEYINKIFFDTYIRNKKISSL